MSYKRLFSKSLAAHQGRLHMAAHSHHLWPDASFEGQVEAWEDGCGLADRKWTRVLGEVWPAAQAEIAAELSLPDPSTLVFASNTHDLLVRLVSAARPGKLKVLATSGEFHSFRRQSARWVESGRIELETVDASAPDLPGRLAERARSGGFDLIFASQVLFGSGRAVGDLNALAELATPEGPWVVIDGYHGFMAVETDLSEAADRVFYLAGGYKYAMAGEGCAFLHAPEGFAARPEITGWYAEFAALEQAPNGGVGYARDAQRLMGATFDPSALYRFLAVRRMLAREGLTTAAVNAHLSPLRDMLLAEVARTPLAGAELLNRPGAGPQARFLALSSPKAEAWKQALAEAGVTVDVRGEVLRIGLGLYHDGEDIRRFAEICARVLT